MTHPVGVVRYPGFVHGWVLDLPGCIAGSGGERELGEALRLSIAEYVAWEGVERAGEEGWETAEQLDGADFAATGGEFLFQWDRQRLAGEEAERWLRLVRLARKDLVAVTERLPAELLDWEPPETALGQNDPWSPHIRSARSIARHALELEVYYRESLRDGLAPGIRSPVTTAAAEHGRTLARLGEELGAEPARVFRPSRPGRPAEEEWTVRKVIRRLISHDRAHTAELEQRRTWVLLGAPVLERGTNR
jgi:hypothetical protein